MSPKLRGLLEWVLFVAAVAAVWVLLPWSGVP
jgi:hypothetical protein